MNHTTYICAFALVLGMIGHAVAEEKGSQPQILLLTKSAGFEHSVIKRDSSGTSLVERVLTGLAAEMGTKIECTKDASLINAASLQDRKVVIFYTSGNLTEAGTDGQPPMSASGVDDLVAWVNNGGGFLGFHAATDSFRSEGDSATPYIKMIGGEFVTHGAQFKGVIRNVSEKHPAIASLPQRWALQDEWYLFKKLDKENMHVLALLEIGGEREKQKPYNIPDYPMLWCKGCGKGRVLYNGMGHREDVWESPAFKALVKDHIRWVGGEGPLDAEPNYSKVVSENIK
jgi:uncharacterized protein